MKGRYFDLLPIAFEIEGLKRCVHSLKGFLGDLLALELLKLSTSGTEDNVFP